MRISLTTSVALKRYEWHNRFIVFLVHLVLVIVIIVVVDNYGRFMRFLGMMQLRSGY